MPVNTNYFVSSSFWRTLHEVQKYRKNKPKLVFSVVRAKDGRERLDLEKDTLINKIIRLFIRVINFFSSSQRTYAIPQIKQIVKNLRLRLPKDVLKTLVDKIHACDAQLFNTFFSKAAQTAPSDAEKRTLKDKLCSCKMLVKSGANVSVEDRSLLNECDVSTRQLHVSKTETSIPWGGVSLQKLEISPDANIAPEEIKEVVTKKNFPMLTELHLPCSATMIPVHSGLSTLKIPCNAQISTEELEKALTEQNFPKLKTLYLPMSATNIPILDTLQDLWIPPDAHISAEELQEKLKNSHFPVLLKLSLPTSATRLPVFQFLRILCIPDGACISAAELYSALNETDFSALEGLRLPDVATNIPRLPNLSSLSISPYASIPADVLVTELTSANFRYLHFLHLPSNTISIPIVKQLLTLDLTECTQISKETIARNITKTNFPVLIRCYVPRGMSQEEINALRKSSGIDFAVKPSELE